PPRVALPSCPRVTRVGPVSTIVGLMKISGVPYRTIWPLDSGAVRVIDQSRLPFELVTLDLRTLEDAAHAIRTMVVRGAPLIGVTAAYGLALAMREDSSSENIERAVAALAATRPTAINLRWALDRAATVLRAAPEQDRQALAFAEAA